MLLRVLEPEVMDTPEEARDYDAMDHAAVNRAFCEDVLAVLPSPGRVLDVGTGTARIPIELCRLAEGAEVVAIDLADHMLALAQENITRAGLASRVTVAKIDAKALPWPDGSFGAVLSNSIVHHIPEPAAVLAEMWRVTSRGGVLFVRDLHRPDSEAEIDHLVALHGGAPPADPAALPSFEHQRSLFRASLAAALTVAEVVALVAPLGIPASAVRMTSDRHWTLSAVKP
ncbi:class I SAM-dependent methyltransferase [Polyangium spumosum]|uniref:Methyltransferase domain-containing protein n=1 Tax=Polyangium spumosum TaxID=889282 RepID=A0A6N7PNN8_9BACT|nr:class I SAM-dependent methyltransferase [Polyangium spumosum]MRG92426.1 methyltransferase domain-containing protein [Polyangium spumosum]